MVAYENAASGEAGHGGRIVGTLNWHKNNYTGAADMNLLSAAFTSSGNRSRDRDAHPVKNLRLRMDQVTDALNLLRKSRGIPPIVTMQGFKKERAQRRGEMDLILLDALMPKPPMTTADLEPVLIKLEYSDLPLKSQQGQHFHHPQREEEGEEIPHLQTPHQDRRDGDTTAGNKKTAVEITPITVKDPKTAVPTVPAPKRTRKKPQEPDLPSLLPNGKS